MVAALDAGEGRFVDLAQPLFADAPRSPAHGEIRIWQEEPFSFELPDGCRVVITHVNSSAHAGTHVDAPRHFLPNGATIDEIELNRFIRPAVVADLRHEGARAVQPEALLPALERARPGDFCFIRFGYAERYRTPDYHLHPFLTRAAAELIVSRGISAVGTDTLTPDIPAAARQADFDFPVHRTLLEADVLIFENLGPGLNALGDTRCLVSAPPLRIQHADGAMVAPWAYLPAVGSQKG
jgi:arylformamidase